MSKNKSLKINRWVILKKRPVRLVPTYQITWFYKFQKTAGYCNTLYKILWNVFKVDKKNECYNKIIFCWAFYDPAVKVHFLHYWINSAIKGSKEHCWIIVKW